MMGFTKEVQDLFNHPNAPHIVNPTKNQRAAIEGYWKAIFSGWDIILDFRKDDPEYLPKFNLVF